MYEAGWASLILAAGWAYEHWDLLAYQEPGRSPGASGGTGGNQEWLATFFSDFLSGSLASILGGAIGGVAVLIAQNRLRHRGEIDAAHKRGLRGFSICNPECRLQTRALRTRFTMLLLCTSSTVSRPIRVLEILRWSFSTATGWDYETNQTTETGQNTNRDLSCL